MLLTKLKIIEQSVLYPVMEQFLTLQGEGFWSGSAAWFIRLAGCDVGCVWCDVKESWAADAHPVLAIDEMLLQAKQSSVPVAVVTGGEPLLHNLDALTEGLKTSGMRTHLETSGTQPLTGEWDWITFSPKKFKAPLDEFYGRHDELKIIIHNRHDLTWAEEQAEMCTTPSHRFLQPDWFRPESVDWIIEYIKKNPKWRMSLQTHKFMNIP